MREKTTTEENEGVSHNTHRCCRNSRELLYMKTSKGDRKLAKMRFTHLGISLDIVNVILKHEEYIPSRPFLLLTRREISSQLFDDIRG